MYDVITVGSSTIDVFAKTEKSDLISFQTRNPSEKESFLAYPIGTKILINDLEFTTGGGGTNTASAISKLGHKVGYIGKIGRDEHGDMIVDRLKKQGTDFLGGRSNKASGYSIILDSIAHDRTILTYKGCNNDFKFSEVKKKLLDTKWFYLCAMVDKSFKELEKIVKFAKKNDIGVMFNPSSYLAEKGIEYLGKVLRGTDILVLNREEAKDLVGNHEMVILLKLLRDLLGANIVIITDGKHGVHVVDDKFHYHGLAHDIKVVETTGAGDAFGSTFLAGMIKKNDVEFAMKMAITNSESVIMHHGAKNNLLDWKGILRMMRKRPVKVKKTKL